jgi:hypothetical protein
MEPGTYLIDFDFTDEYNFYAPTSVQIEYLVPEPEDPVIP